MLSFAHTVYPNLLALWLISPTLKPAYNPEMN